MTDIDYRASVLKEFGANDVLVDELLAYNENHFNPSAGGEIAEDEPFVSTWSAYLREADSVGAFTCLRRRLLQLQFPIKRGVSSTAEYLDATRRGKWPPPNRGLILADPDGVGISLHSTPAGRIPLIIVKNRSDFTALVQALVRRNEPEEISPVMGACFVSGYNNWDRLQRYRRDWQSKHPESRWSDEMHRIAARKELYQDRFIVLSVGPYSGVSAVEMGMSERTWRRLSLAIRREHECTHYFTKRCLGSMRSNLLDEIIADYMGIIEVAGRFRADWFLRFMGLSAFPAYRGGGRFENYVAGVSEGAKSILRLLLVRAAASLERYVPVRFSENRLMEAKASTLRHLTTLTLEDLAVGGRIIRRPHHPHESANPE